MTAPKFSRRSVLHGSAAAVATLSLPAVAAGETEKPFPLESDLRVGDLLWPKLPGAIIPYSYRRISYDADRAQWEKEKAAKLETLAPHITLANVVLYNRLKDLSYEDFLAEYQQASSDPFITYGNSIDGLVTVGHVAIVIKDLTGGFSVVEATPPKVITSTYAQWVAGRAGQIAWQGRVKSLSDAQAAAFAAAAQTYIGVPYDFWNFDLSDATGFYCSKLVWLALMRATAQPVDGDSNARRTFWLSPKQVLYARSISILLDQGNYSNA